MATILELEKRIKTLEERVEKLEGLNKLPEAEVKGKKKPKVRDFLEESDFNFISFTFKELKSIDLEKNFGDCGDVAKWLLFAMFTDKPGKRHYVSKNNYHSTYEHLVESARRANKPFKILSVEDFDWED